MPWNRMEDAVTMRTARRRIFREKLGKANPMCRFFFQSSSHYPTFLLFIIRFFLEMIRSAALHRAYVAIPILYSDFCRVPIWNITFPMNRESLSYRHCNMNFYYYTTQLCIITKYDTLSSELSSITQRILPKYTREPRTSCFIR